jgi:hypothetical protein
LNEKKYEHIYSVEPVDSSPHGLEELKFILEALFAELNSFETEELKQYLKAYLARPKEERTRETRAIIRNAKMRFRGKKDN